MGEADLMTGCLCEWVVDPTSPQHSTPVKITDLHQFSPVTGLNTKEFKVPAAPLPLPPMEPTKGPADEAEGDKGAAAGGGDLGGPTEPHP